MALNYNLFLAGGNLVNDPDLRSANGKDICTFRLAVNDRREDPLFIACVAWGKTAEFIHQYFKKGSPIFISGRLQSKRYTDKDGVERYGYEINIKEANFSGNKGETEAVSEKPKPAPKAIDAEKPEFTEVDTDDDLPF